MFFEITENVLLNFYKCIKIRVALCYNVRKKENGAKVIRLGGRGVSVTKC